MKTISSWTHGEVFNTTDGNNELRVDGRSAEGMNPKALLLAGLACCAGIDVVEILAKMRIAFSDFSVEAEAEQTGDQPRVFRDFILRFRVKAGEENRDKITRAIELSLEKYCGVAAMLRRHAPIRYELETTT